MGTTLLHLADGSLLPQKLDLVSAPCRHVVTFAWIYPEPRPGNKPMDMSMAYSVSMSRADRHADGVVFQAEISGVQGYCVYMRRPQDQEVLASRLYCSLFSQRGCWFYAKKESALVEKLNEWFGEGRVCFIEHPVPVC